MLYEILGMRLPLIQSFGLFDLVNKITTELLYSHLQHHNDTIIKTQEDFFINIYTSHFICKVRKGCSRFACERVLETEQKLQYFDLTVMTVTLCLSLFLMLNRRPWVHSSVCWLSLLHLISIFSGPQTPSRFPEASSAGCCFPYHISSPSQLELQLYWPQLPLGLELQLSSVQFFGLILPSNSHAEIWTRLHASAMSSDIWRSGCVTSAIFGMACVIVIERK